MVKEKEALIITPKSTLKAYLELVFEDAGLQTVCAQSLRQALQLLKNTTPAIIVLDDLHEDGLDSAGLVWRLKRIKRLRRAPTIQVISKSSERERVTIEISGADHIVELPIKDKSFRRLIEDLLSNSR